MATFLADLGAVRRAFRFTERSIDVLPFNVSVSTDKLRSRFVGVAIPARVLEVLVGLDKVVDGEVVFAVVEAGTTADDLLEFYHGVDRTQQDDVSNVEGINTGGEFLGGGEDCGNGLLIVLELLQQAFSFQSVIGCDADRVHRVAVVDLINHIADLSGVVLRGAEDQRLLIFADVFHELLDSTEISLLNLDVACVEVVLCVNSALVNFTGQNFILRGVYVVVKGALHLAVAERSEEAIGYALLERVRIDGVAKVLIGVGINVAPGRSREANLHCRSEVFHNLAPTTLVIRSATVTLINDNKVKEVTRVLAKGVLLAIIRHKGLEDGEEDGTVGGNLAAFLHAAGCDAHQGILLKAEEAVEGLVGEDIPVGQE